MIPLLYHRIDDWIRTALVLVAMMVCLGSLSSPPSFLASARPPIEEGFFGLPTSPYIPKLNITPVVAGALLIVAGFILLFFGVRLLKPILFLTGLGLGAIIVNAALLNIDHDFGPNDDVICLAIALAVGFLLGGLFVYFVKGGLLALGALGGFFLATWVLSWKEGGLIQSDLWRPVFIAGVCILFSSLTLFFESILVVICTSLTGAGSLCAGVDVFAATGFIEALKYVLTHRDAVELNDKLLGLLISFLLMTLFGILIQVRLHLFKPKPASMGSSTSPAKGKP